MKKMLLSAAALCAVLCAEAKVILPGVIGDNMVLQRNAEVKLWGMAAPGGKVVVTPSWSGETVAVKVGKDGKWLATLETGEAGGPYSITFDDGEPLVVGNVLLGEVWFCSGQSNMEMPVVGFPEQPTEKCAETILEARPETPIRMCTVRRGTAYEEKDDCDASWSEHVPTAVGNVSATAYFFAEYLNKVLRVPVGIIVSSWGGTRIEAWMDRETVGAFPGYDLSYLDAKEGEPQWDAPTLMYNAMVAPLRNYTLKGLLWYQGEANRHNYGMYAELQASYVKMMRRLWGLGELPFYFVQIAPYVYEGADGTSGALLQEAQMKSLSLIPHSGMAVTLDIGDLNCIHPAKKREVGHRLACMALETDYGFGMVDSRAPLYESMEVKDGKAVVSFRVGGIGLAPLGRALTGFEVAGSDRIFHPAKAAISGRNTVDVVCAEVSEPVAVRYCFHNFTDGDSFLYNGCGMPASPFRTDDWD